MGRKVINQTHVQRAAEAYGLRVKSIKPLDGGHSNTNYLLTTATQDYVLTAVDNELPEMVRGHVKLLQWLAEHAFATSIIQPTLGGQLLTEQRGRLIFVKDFIEGESVPMLTGPMLEQVGCAMATMHQLPIPPWIGTLHSFEQLYELVINNDLDPQFGAWFAQHVALGKQDSAELPSGLIHADVFWDNLIFKDEQLQAIIDFEHGMRGRFAFDLGMAMVGTCALDGQLDLNRACALMRGYEKVRPLEDEEWAVLQQQAAYAAAMTACWRFWRYRIDLESAENAQLYRVMVSIADHIVSIAPDCFLAEMNPLHS